MDRLENINEERNLKLFNTPLEIGLRTLFLLRQFENESLSLDKMIYCDYFLLHAGDISSKQTSLHPNYPFRSSEIIIKRQLLNNALRLLISKELIEIEYSNSGITYKISNIGIRFIEYMNSDYASQLLNASNWVYNKYKNYTEHQLQLFFNKNMKKWGGEFINEAKFR